MAYLESANSSSKRRLPPKKKKKVVEEKVVTSAMQKAQGRGGVAPANYKPAISAPVKKTRLPSSVLAKKNTLDREDTLPNNVTNLTLAAKNANITLSAKQAMELLTSTDKSFSTNEWGKFLAPSLSPDPFVGNMKQILRDYYNWTGNFPDAQTAKNLIQRSSAGEDTPAPRFNANDPLTMWDIISDRANDKAATRADNNQNRVGGKNGNRWALKDIEKWGSVKKADYMRALANAPQRTLDKEWERDDDKSPTLTNSDIDLINEARTWYGGTTLKKRINKRQAEEQQQAYATEYMNADGTANRAAIRLLAKLTNTSNQDIRNPHTFVGLRERTFGEDVIGKKAQEDLNKFGTYLSTIYPTLKRPKDGNYAWNANFDKKASLFMFQSNIGFATAENPYDQYGNAQQKRLWQERDNRRRIAMANISIASYGAIKAEDDLRAWMHDAGFLAPKGETAMFSDRYTQWLFEDCYLKTQRPPNQSMEITIFNFVRDWGNGNPDSLPGNYRKYYDDIIDNFSFTLANAEGGEDDGGNVLARIFDAEVEQLNAWRNGLIPYQPIDERGKSIGPVMGTIPKDKTDIARDRAGVALQPDEQAPLYYEKNGIQYTIGEDGKFHVTKNTRRKSGGKGYNPQGKAIDLAIAPGSFAETFYFDIMPKVALPYQVISGELPTKMYNRVYMTLALMGAHGGGSSTTAANVGTLGIYGRLDAAAKGEIEKDNLEAGGRESFGSVKQAAAGLYAANPSRLTIPLEANQYSWSSITDAFNEAGQLSSDINNMPWMKESLTRMGIDPEKNGLALFLGDLAWSIALDVMMDAGVGAIARATAGTTASVMRRLSSDKLIAHVAAAENHPVVQGASRLLKQANDAERTGEHVLAARLRTQAIEQFEEPMLGKVQQAKRKLSDLTPEARAKVDKRVEKITKNKDLETVVADLKLMNRPAWYDTMASSLSSGKQHPIAVAEILGIRKSMIPDKPEFLKYTKIIGESLDTDDIIIAMNRLADIAKIKLDPGRLMIGKMLHFNSLQYGNNAYDEFFTVLPRDNRVAGGLVDAEHHVLTAAGATRLGMDPDRTKDAADRAWYYITRLSDIDADDTLSETRKALDRRIAWDEFQKEIETNVRAMKFSDDLYRNIVKYAKRNGMDTSVFEQQYADGKLDMWGLFNAMRMVKNHKSLGRILARGGKTSSYFDEVQKTTPWLLAGKNTEGQQAQDLVFRFNVQDLASFMHGKAIHQMKIYSKVPAGPVMLPSMMDVTNIGRTFATASLAFPFSALFIDEIWRFIPEMMKRNIVLKGGKELRDQRVAIKAANKEFVERFIATDALESQIHEAHEFVPIVASETPKEYAAIINRWIKSFKKQEFHEEFLNFSRELQEFVIKQGSKRGDVSLIPDDVMKGLFKEHLMEYIWREENADIRAALIDTRRLGDEYVIPPVLKSQMDDFQEQLDNIDLMMGDHADEWRGLRKRLHEIRMTEFDVSKTRRKEILVPLSASSKRRADKFLGSYQSDRTLDGFWNRFNENPNEKTFGELKDAIVLRLNRELKDMRKDIDAYKAESALATTPAEYTSKAYKTKGRAQNHATQKAEELDTTVYLNKEQDGTWTVSTTSDNRSMESFRPREKATEPPATTTPKAEKPAPVEWVQAPDNADLWVIGRGDYRIELTEYDDGVYGAIIYWGGKQSEAIALKNADYLTDAQKQMEKRLDELSPEPVEVEELAGFTDEGIDESLGASPASPLAEGEDPDIEFMESQYNELSGELARVTDPKRGPKFTRETIDEPYSGRTMNLQKLISQVHRPTKRSWIFDWLDNNGYRSTYPNIYADGKAMGGKRSIRGSFANQGQVKAWFAENGIPESEYNRMYYDYKADRLSEFGVDLSSDLLQEEADLGARVKYLVQHRRELAATRKEFVKIGPPKPNKLKGRGNKYIDSVVDRNFLFFQTPELWDAVRNGRKLTKDDIQVMLRRKVDLPNIAGVRGRKAGWRHSNGEVGWVPILSAYAEAVPYRLMNWMGNMTRQAAFLGNFKVEYRELIRQGVDVDTAIDAAQSRARQYVDSIMYTPGQTLAESQLGAYAYFLPAYRQAINYWSKEFVRHPFVYNELRNRFGEDMPNMYWDGNYGAYIPMPMWLTNNPAEMTVPGLSLPILMPLRFVNTWTGWENKKDLETGKYKWKYTGNTSLDWMADNAITSPLTGFASKSVSPLSVVDDLLYGKFGEDSFLFMETDHAGLALAATLGYALRKDPMERRAAATRIMQAQMSRGYKPNAGAYEDNLRGSPWWYELLAGGFGIDALKMDNPEAILSGLSREFFIRKISYSPMDINIDSENERAKHSTGFLNMPSFDGKVSNNLWKTIKLFDDADARTMADAEYEFYQSDGNQNKQREILAKYPKLKAKFDFFGMDAITREEYLSNPKNRWLIPYISGKTMYDGITGAPLTQGEYYDQMTRGAAIYKANETFVEGISQKLINAEWSEKLTVLEKERDARLKKAHNVMIGLINEYSVTPQQKENRLKALMGYEERWWGEVPPDRFKNGEYKPLWWMNKLARFKWGSKAKDMFLEYDPQAIKTAHYWATQDVGAYNPNRPQWAPAGEKMSDEEGNKPLAGGTEQYYSNAAFKRFTYEEGTGKQLRIDEALGRFLEPDDRAIFNMSNSLSIGAIKESKKNHESFRRYAVNKVINKAYYELNSVEELEAVIPNLFNPVTGIGSKQQMEDWLWKADNAYQLKTAAATANGPVPDYYSDEYEAEKKKYDNTMKTLMKMPIAAIFRDGPAGILIRSYLVDPGEGKTWNKKYATQAAKRLYDKDVDYDDIVDDFPIGKTKYPARVEAANAWASIIVAATAGRDRIEAARKADDGHIGDTQRLVASRLSKYADSWRRRSDRFKGQWDEQGGTEMVKKLLGLW